MDTYGIFGIELPELLLHLSYLLLVIGSLVRTILPLRVLIIFSCIAGLLSGFFTDYDAMMIWEAGFLAVNVVQVGIILHERNTINLTPEERELHAKKFSGLQLVDFHKLVRIGSWVTAEPGVHLTTQGSPVSRILLIAEGTAQVEIDGTVVAYCALGDFVGEMAFVSGNPASATVTTIAQTRYLMWRFEELHGLLAKHPDIQSALQTVFSKNLIEKLSRDSADLTAKV